MKKNIIIVQIVSLCVLVLIFGVYIRVVGQGNTFVVAPFVGNNSLSKQLSIDEFPLINPAVTANLGKHYIINFLPLRTELATIQKAQKGKTYIYFLYLNNAAWIGLNEKDLFTAASTVKVPLAMSIYKLAEQKTLDMNDTYTLNQLDLDENFGTLYKVGPDKSFTIEDLVGIMLQYSDNTAARALLHVTELVGIKDPFAEVYEAMGWQKIEFGSKPTYIEINEKTLANMFISLYNTTYLNAVDSQKVLNYLDLSTFNQQIAAGIPAGVPVSHKIGIDDGDKTYSDCGIVYVPLRPYILCLGIQGEPQTAADSFMKKVSQTVYKYVINN